MAEIQFDIVGNFNINGLDKATDQIHQAVGEIGALQKELKGSMDGLDAPAALLNEQLKKCLVTAEQFTEKASQASAAITQGTMSKDEQSTMSQQLQNIFDDFNAMKSVLTGTGDLSVSLAKSMLSGLPNALKQEFNSIAPLLTAELRAGMSSLNKSQNRITSTNASGMVVDALKIPAISKLLNQTSATSEQKANLIRSLLPNAASIQNFQEYQMTRFGRPIKANKGPSSVEELLPSAYKGRYKNVESFLKNNPFIGVQDLKPDELYLNERIKKHNARSVLDTRSTGKLVNLIKQNAVAARAAESVGIVSRDKAGVLNLNHNITQKELFSLREALWKEFQTRTTGLTEKIDDYFGLNYAPKAKQGLEDMIIKRGQSGTSGLTLAAMQGLSDLLEYGEYSKANPKSGVLPEVHRIIRPDEEAKRIKELYTVDKISPFAKGEMAQPRKVSLAESQMTRMLGMQGKNFQDMDSVKIISFAGYDPNNPEHVKKARELKEQGYTDANGHFSVHAIHGTGNDTVFRMIRDKEAQQLKERYVPFARALGLKGTNVLNAFVPETDADGNPYQFSDPESLGKHMEQLNKMWTDSYVWGSDLSNKRFAFVDFSKDGKKHSDGLGYLGKGIGPGNFQTRFGLSGKGSFYEIGTETIGEWAKNAGLVDNKGRYMVKGIDGSEFDASSYNGLIDISTVKNLLAYKGMSNEQANAALTAMIREFPLGIVSDYEYDGNAKGLGSQMMTFLAMSPAIQMHQARQLAKHRLELETNEGKRRYIFNNPETDIVAKKANDLLTGDEFIASDPAARQHYDRYIESLNLRMQAGEFINFDDIADIQNERLLRSPLFADILTKGGLTSSLIKQYQKEFQETHKREFTEEEVRDILTLKNGVADFAHMDSDTVAALRSPTGFNQMIVRKNYAKLLAPIYARHGMQAFGFHANDEDMNTLAGADMDADMVKAIATKANSENIDIVAELAHLKEMATSLGITDKEAEIITHALPTLAGGNNIQNTENWLRTLALSVAAPQKMGAAADAGSRMAGSLNLFDVTMRNAAIAAAKANNAYDPATTLPKKPKEIEQDAALITANMLGQEYQKIPAHLNDIYNVLETRDNQGNIIYTTKDGKTVIANEDVFKASSGRLMNKKYLQGEDNTRLDKTNLPSVQSSAAVGAMLASKIQFEKGYTDTQLMDDLLEVMGVTAKGESANHAIGYNGAGPATQRLMKNKRAMLAQFIGGVRFSISGEERDIIASQYAESLEEIEKQVLQEEIDSAKKGANIGNIITKEGKQITTASRVNQLKRQYGLSQIEMMLGTYKGLKDIDVITGMTYENIKEKYGENIANALVNTGVVKLPENEKSKTYSELNASYRNIGDNNVHFSTKPSNPPSSNPPPPGGPPPSPPNPPPPGGPPSDPPWFYNHDRFMEDMINKDRTGINRILRGQSALSAWENIIKDTEQETATLFGEVNKGKDLTSSDKWYRARNRQYDYLKQAKDEAMAIFESGEAFDAENAIVRQANNKLSTYGNAFALGRTAHVENTIKNITDYMTETVDGKSPQVKGQLDQIENWGRAVKTLEDEKKGYISTLKRVTDVNNEGQDISSERISELDSAIKSAKQKAEKGIQQFIDGNTSQLEDIGAEFDTLISGKKKSPITTINKQIDSTQKQADKAVALMEELHSHGLISDETYDKERSLWDVRLEQIKDGTYRDKIVQEEASKLGFRGQKTRKSETQREFAQQLLDDALVDFHSPHSSVDEYLSSVERVKRYRGWLQESKYTKQSEQHEAHMDKIQTEQMLENRKASRQEMIDAAVDRAVIARNNYIARQGEDFDADAYRKKYSEKYIRSRIEDEMNQKEQMSSMTSASRLYSLEGESFINPITGNEMTAIGSEKYRSEQINLAGRQFDRQQRMRGVHSRLLQSYYQRETQRENLELKGEDLRNKIADETRNQQILKEQEKTATGSDKDNLAVKIAESQAKLRLFNQELQQTQAQAQTLTSGQNLLGATFEGISTSLTRVFSRFGRQFFYKAINEVKQFVKEYDKSMTEIQMITLKSDNEISTLGTKLIDTAKNTGSTVTEVTSAASNLYRQGLSDEEVDERLDDVIKFSKVAGIKTTEASKIITTALQNGLVGDSEEAMDALVALGDSAATTASEIAKGMQKSAAAAKQSGMSYGELVTLLTIGTSKTQLGGSTLGSSLNTLIYRLYKVNKGEDFTDENGRHIANTAATSALNKLGVDLYDENGNFRGPYQVLQDIAANWDSADDTTQSMLLTTLGAGRQRSNIATLLQGMYEDNGELANKYLSTATSSKGITDRKYTDYLDSLQAKLNGVKTSFDGLIESFKIGEGTTGFLDFIKTFLDGLTRGEELLGHIPSLITGIGVAATALVSLISSHPVLAGLLIGVTAISGIISTIGNISHNLNPEVQQENQLKRDTELYETFTSNGKSKLNSYESLIEETKRLGEEREKAIKAGKDFDNTEAGAALKSNLEQLIGIFPSLNSEIENSADILEHWAEIISGAGEQVSTLKAKTIEQAKVLAQPINKQIKKSLEENIKEVQDEYKDLEEILDSTTRSGLQTGTISIRPSDDIESFTYDNGKLHFTSKGIEDFVSVVRSFGVDNPRETIASWFGNKSYSDSFADLPFKNFIVTNGNTEEETTALTALLNALLEEDYEAFKNPDVLQALDYFQNKNKHQYVNEISLFKSGYTKRFPGLWDMFLNDLQEGILPYHIDENLLENEKNNRLMKSLGITSGLTNFNSSDALSLYAILASAPNLIDGSSFLIGDSTSFDLENGKEYKEKLKPLLRFLYSKKSISSPLVDYYNDEDAFMNAYESGFMDFDKGSVNLYEAIGELAAQLHTIITNENDPTLKAYANERKEKLQEAYKSALDDYMSNNPDVMFAQGFDTYASQAIVNALIKRNGEDLSWVENEDVPAQISELVNEWVQNKKGFEISNLNPDEMPYQYHGIGFRTKVDAEDYIRQAARRDYTDNHGMPGYRSADEYIKHELRTFNGGYGNDFVNNIINGVDAYKLANEKTATADSLLSAINEKSINNFTDFVSAVDTGDIQNFGELLTIFPDLAMILQDFIEEIKDEETGETKTQLKSDMTEDEGNLLFNFIKNFIQGKSSTPDVYRSSQDIYNAALEYSVGKNEAHKDSYQQIIGQTLTAKKQTDAGFTAFETELESTLLENYKNNIQGLTDLDKIQKQRELYDAALNGTYRNIVQEGTDWSAISAYTSGNQNLENVLRAAGVVTDYNSKNGTNITLQDYADNQAAYDELTTQLKEAGVITDNFQEGLIEVDEAITKSDRDISNFAKDTKSATSAIDLFSKNVGKQSNALLQMNQQMMKISQNQWYREQFKNGKRDSKTMKGIAGLLSVDEKTLKGMDDGVISKLLEATKKQDEKAIEGYTDSISSNITDTLQKQMNDKLQSGEAMVIKGMDITVENGSVDIDMSTELAEVSQYLSDAEKDAIAMLNEWGIKAHLQINKNGENFEAKIVLDSMGSGTTPSGGGGGGGKSKADKLIEEQKRKMAILEHESKMLQSEEKLLDYRNDYSGWGDNIEKQIELQYRMKNAYAENIQELKDLMATTKAESDNWYKLRDAIYAAEEAMKETANTINELNSKSIAMLSDQLENADKPLDHRTTMLEKYAQTAMSEDRFADYLRFSQQHIEALQEQRKGNDAEIEKWKEELAQFEKDSDAWREVRDKIYALEEENADLDNQLAQQQLELNQQRLSQIAKILQQDTQTANHNQNIANAYGSAYQSGGYRAMYEDMIREQQKATNNLITENKKAEKSALDQMSTLEESTTAWFEAQAAVYQYQEAIAQAYVSQMEYNRALAESNIESITEDYTDATREVVHVNELLNEQANQYKSIGDYEAYYKAMGMYLENMPMQIEAQRDALARLQSQYNEGMENETLDPTTQRRYLDEINQRESELQKLLNEQDNKQRELEKTRIDNILSDMDYAQSEYEHNQKLISYQASRYQNNGELTNYGLALEEDTKLRQARVEELTSEIETLRKEQEKLYETNHQGSEEEKRLVEQIKKKEEAVESENTQIDKNNKLLEENNKKILQVRKTLEDAVDKEIEAEKKRRREILAANVNMQNTIVDLLKKRLQAEWNLRKKDLDKQKEELDEYKKLITERFNYRKKASQQADKDEELADYRRQLALIEADPTRTKEAKELRRNIEELEKEQAWAIAEDELNAETERVDDNIEGIDKFVQYNEELLNEILGDANNFADEINNILSGSFEESYARILDFMSKENEAFMKSLPDTQKQMIQGWEDTWKKAKDYLESNYAEITDILQSEDSYMSYMKETDDVYRNLANEYENAKANNDIDEMRRLESAMRLAEIEFSEKYQNVIKAEKNDATFDLHEHTLGDVVSSIDELKNNIFQVNIVGITGDVGGPYGLDNSGVRTIDFSNGEDLNLNDLDGIYKAIELASETSDASTGSKGSGKKTTAPKKNNELTDDLFKSIAANGNLNLSNFTATLTEQLMKTYSLVSDSGIIKPNEQKKVEKEIEDAVLKNERIKLPYAEGGLVDFTGPTWVDGTKNKPEAFLDATDTSLLRSMLDSFNYIKVQPHMSYLDPSVISNSSSVGDINITINQAELGTDADINDVARRVGQAFSKELSKQGLNLSGYAFT